MGVRVVLAKDGRLLATVEGAFDFASSRQLLHDVGQLWHNDARALVVRLRRVQTVNSCAIGALMLLGERAGAKLGICLDDCADSVRQLFDSGLLDRHLPERSVADCGQCRARRSGQCTDDGGGPLPGGGLVAA